LIFNSENRNVRPLKKSRPLSIEKHELKYNPLPDKPKQSYGVLPFEP